MIMVNRDKFLLALAKAAMTTTELKVKSGVGRNTISKIMNNEATIRPAIIGKLAKALNVQVEQLIDIGN
jgi:DNA-binding Xre family transcriptional regulator